MNKQSNIFFGILVIVLLVGGFFLFKQLDKKPTDSANTQEPFSVVGENTATSDESANLASSEQKENTKPLQATNTAIKMDKDITTLSIKTLKEGTGDIVSKNGDRLTMNYTGSLLNGTKFDSNVDPAFGHVSPFDFVIGKGMVIRGWEEGLLGMKVGEKRLLTIPAAMAYGSMSPSPLIPPNSALVFEVELLKIN